MAKRLYQSAGNAVIKIRLQHQAPNDQLSHVLKHLYENIDKSKLVGSTSPRLGTNPKYAGNQATAIYLEMNANDFIRLFNGISIIDIDYEDVTEQKALPSKTTKRK